MYLLRGKITTHNSGEYFTEQWQSREGAEARVTQLFKVQFAGRGKSFRRRVPAGWTSVQSVRSVRRGDV